MRSYRSVFHGSARLEEELRVLTRVSRMGRTSHTMEIRIERLAQDGDPVHVFDGEIVLVGLDDYEETPRATAIPDDLRARIVAYEGDALEQA